jgi:hypothetical protein
MAGRRRRGQEPTVRGTCTESGQCAAERLSMRSNTWRFVSTLVQTPVGRPKCAYLANDPVYRLFTMSRALCLVWVPSGDMVWVGRYGGVKSALSALFIPKQNQCQIVSNDFGLISNFTRVCLGYFGATLIFGLCGFEFEIQVLNYLNFP